MERTQYAAGTPCWVDLATTDPEAARDFYGDLFGWSFDVSPDANTQHYTMCQKASKNVAGMLGEPDSDRPPAWVTYFASDDIDTLADRISAEGGALVMGPVRVQDSGSMLVAQDPTGAFFGAWQAGAHFGAQLVNEPSTLTWNELHTRDLDTAAAFYSAVLGTDLEDLPEAQGFRYKLVKVGDAAVGGMYEMGHDAPPDRHPLWLTYFAVDDPDSTVDAAVRSNATLVNPLHDSPYGRHATLADPQGATFCVIESPKQS